MWYFESDDWLLIIKKMKIIGLIVIFANRSIDYNNANY